MTDKVMSLHEAAGLVQPGDTLALGGMTLYRRPVAAFVRELIGQGTGDLTLLTFTAGYESDLLVGSMRTWRNSSKVDLRAELGIIRGTEG